MQPRLFYNILLSKQILISKMEEENKMTITKDLQAISKELIFRNDRNPTGNSKENP